MALLVIAEVLAPGWLCRSVTMRGMRRRTSRANFSRLADQQDLARALGCSPMRKAVNRFELATRRAG